MSVIVTSSVMCPFDDCLRTFSAGTVEMRTDGPDSEVVILILDGDVTCPQCKRELRSHPLVESNHR